MIDVSIVRIACVPPWVVIMERAGLLIRIVLFVSGRGLLLDSRIMVCFNLDSELWY